MDRKCSTCGTQTTEVDEHSCHEVLRAALTARDAQLAEAVECLRKLASEATAWAGDIECADAMGRTNTVVLDGRIKEARAFLAIHEKKNPTPTERGSGCE